MANASLPIEVILTELLEATRGTQRVIVQAPPGAGKTTIIPVALLQTGWVNGRIILIQPRRLAAYAAASRMAGLLGETVGQTVGYRTRHDSAVSKATRIEVVTDGIFLRWIQSDPALGGISAVLFDEFHERTVAMDLGLGFALEAHHALREDDDPLYLIVMSATLDGPRFAEWLDAAFFESAGRLYPVDIHHSPLLARQVLSQHIAQVTLAAMRGDPGDALVFLPGFREINQVRRALTDAVPSGVVVHSLHASLPQTEQMAALNPAAAGQRKIVLATNIAETSVTIEGIRIVVDSGLARVSRHDERRGLDMLETRRVSLASARQRTGRAGRTSSGICHRLWSRADEATMAAFDEPDILKTDLVPVALELAQWGAPDFPSFKLPTQPNPDAWTRALQILQSLGAMDSAGRLTPQGQQLSELGMHPRLGLLLLTHRHTALASAALGCAALMSEGDPLRFPGESPHADIRLRLASWQHAPTFGVLQRNTWQGIQKTVKQLARRTRSTWEPEAADSEGIAEALAQAWPDRIAQLREHSATRYRMMDGRGVKLNNDDSLAGSPWLVVLDTAGQAGGATTQRMPGETAARELTVVLACSIGRGELENALGHLFRQREVMAWNKQRQRVDTEHQLVLGELVISSQAVQKPWSAALSLAVRQCLLEQLIADRGAALPWSDRTSQLRARMQWLHQQDPEQWPDMSDQRLFGDITALDEWLGPDLDQRASFASLASIDLTAALKRRLSWAQWPQLDQLAPVSLSLKNGQTVEVDYQDERGPVIRVRLQALFGLDEHPRLGNGATLLIELLSPARRPLQVTSDLPGFWSGSYREVAKEMRGRYPKHPWPDDPAQAVATTRAKPRR
ncbi:ATP-dependent helicase HrpB [Allohahella marinimesophila]|uniref:ATP-dependent helicase HrpB n=1 Tax=Allohahella marinimesophila TaxID=1054972 RepID=A0ABP7NIZ3_9GAMM